MLIVSTLRSTPALTADTPHTGKISSDHSGLPAKPMFDALVLFYPEVACGSLVCMLGTKIVTILVRALPSNDKE